MIVNPVKKERCLQAKVCKASSVVLVSPNTELIPSMHPSRSFPYWVVIFFDVSASNPEALPFE